MIRAVFLSLIFLASCSQAGTHVYEERKVDGENSQFQRTGVVTYEGFVTAFRGYAWAEQVALYASVSDQSEGSEVVVPGPAIKVTDATNDGASLFVSAIGSAQAFGYVVGIIYPKEFVLEPEAGVADQQETVKTETVRWAEVFVVKPPELVERYAQKFFAGDAQSLLDFMRKAPPFVSGEASEIANLGE